MCVGGNVLSRSFCRLSYGVWGVVGGAWSLSYLGDEIEAGMDRGLRGLGPDENWADRRDLGVLQMAVIALSDSRR